MHLLDHSPRFSSTYAVDLAEAVYGIRSSATPLPSERDQNFLLTSVSGEQFVLKISNSLEEQGLLEAQNAILNYLEPRIPLCQRIVRTSDGQEMTRISSGHQNFVRLVNFIPGTPLAKVVNPSPELLRDLGCKLGQLDRQLSHFDHAAVHRDFHWDLAKARNVIEEYGPLIVEPALRNIVHRCATDFDMPELRRSVIHGDANDYNVIVADSRVVGLIDFGDVVHSYTVADLAIALAYVVLDKPEPLKAAAAVVAGYHSEYPLSDHEFSVLFDLMLMRLCMSVCHAAHQRRAQPDNEYLNISQAGVEKALVELASMDRAVALEFYNQSNAYPR